MPWRLRVPLGLLVALTAASALLAAASAAGLPVQRVVPLTTPLLVAMTAVLSWVSFLAWVRDGQGHDEEGEA